MTATSAPPAPRASARVHVQKFGTFLSNMVLPNISAFIAWGLITAMFIQVGWINLGGNPGWLSDSSWVARFGGWGDFAGKGIVGPMIVYLLPLLIGYTGGKNLYGTRGGVVGAIATMGVIAGTDIPMFLGAMIMGPLGGWTMKKLDALWVDSIRPGFEMLINNFSAGIWGGILATLGFFGLSPVVTWLANAAGNGVQFLVDNRLLPLTSIVIEPAKVLFLNNAINHGVLTPLGIQQAADTGKSILFLLEANPGPGLGLLMAYWVFGKGTAKASAPGAALIHFVGGIHEIYFPYVLMKPRLILAMIAGGMTQILTNVVFGSGLRAPAAPGSIIAVLVSTANDSYVGVILSVIFGAAATFGVAALLLKTDRSTDDGDLAAATASMEAMKGKKSVASAALHGGMADTDTHRGPIHSIVFACDAGMGSSAMGASVLRRKIKAAGYSDVTVVNKAISELNDEYDLVVTHQDLTARAAQKTPSAMHVPVDNFMNSPKYDEVVDLLATTNNPEVAAGGSTDSAASGAPSGGGVATTLLATSAIVLTGQAKDRDGAIAEAGNLLVQEGAVTPAYVDSMAEREKSVSTYMGNLLAIPHGTNEAKSAIVRTAISFVRYPDGIEWNGKPVKFVLGIAGAGDDHLQLLQQVATVFLDQAQIDRLEAATTPEQVQEILASIDG